MAFVEITINFGLDYTIEEVFTKGGLYLFKFAKQLLRKGIILKEGISFPLPFLIELQLI